MIPTLNQILQTNMCRNKKIKGEPKRKEHDKGKQKRDPCNKLHSWLYIGWMQEKKKSLVKETIR